MTEAELELVYAKHSYSILEFDTDLNVLSSDSSHEDLIALIFSGKRYFVDRNIPWKSVAKLVSNKSTSFLLGRTVFDEDPDIGHLFETKLHALNNLFAVIPNPTPNGFQITIHLMDESFQHVFDLDSRRDVRRKTGKFLHWSKQQTSNIEFEKREILALLKIKDINELVTIADQSETISSLAKFVRQQVPNSQMKYGLSAIISRCCYAILLAENFPEIRSEFSATDYLNVFGDALLLQNALFFHAGILTKDKALKRMADYAALEHNEG